MRLPAFLALRPRLTTADASVNIDLMGHVGRLDSLAGVSYGLTKESPWREERNACGPHCEPDSSLSDSDTP